MTSTTSATRSTDLIGDDDLADYRRDGFVVLRGFLPADEVAEIKARFDDLAAAGETVPDHWEPRLGDDPLARYPRVMHPHRFDDASRDLLIDPRFRDVLRRLLDDEPLAVQTMFYFKPPGSRGTGLPSGQLLPQGQAVQLYRGLDRHRPLDAGERRPVGMPRNAGPRHRVPGHRRLRRQLHQRLRGATARARPAGATSRAW